MIDAESHQSGHRGGDDLSSGAIGPDQLLILMMTVDRNPDLTTNMFFVWLSAAAERLLMVCSWTQIEVQALGLVCTDKFCWLYRP